MNKIVLGLILILYFGNYHISNYFFENDIDSFFIMKYAIYSILIVLAIFYKYENHFFDNLLIASILNNIYALSQKENYYSINDIIFIITIITLGYVRKHKRNYRKYHNRIIGFFSNIIKKKK